MKTISFLDYSNASIIARSAEEQLFIRLQWVTLQPRRILVVGCGICSSTEALKSRYPDAEIISIDYSQPMLDHLNKMQTQWVCDDLTQVASIEPNSVDLILSNLFLPWCSNVEIWFAAWQRLLKPEGLLLFTSLGPDTLIELKPYSLSLPFFADMHNVGDALLQAKFADPVLDVEWFSLHYRDHEKLRHELYVTGMVVNGEHFPSCDKTEWNMTYEVVYGHAWKPALLPTSQMDHDGTVKIPLSAIRRHS